MKDSTVRTAGLLRAQTPDALARIRDAIAIKQSHIARASSLSYPCLPCWLTELHDDSHQKRLRFF